MTKLFIQRISKVLSVSQLKSTKYFGKHTLIWGPKYSVIYPVGGLDSQTFRPKVLERFILCEGTLLFILGSCTVQLAVPLECGIKVYWVDKMGFYLPEI